MRKLAAGNWKMNGSRSALSEITALMAALPDAKSEVLICPPATLITEASRLAAGHIAIGAQDCHQREKGAHTGDLSARMLAEAGASHVILGHSERRQDHGETDALIRSKAEAAIAAGLTVVLCLGETESQRLAGATLDVIAGQLEGSLPGGARPFHLVIAYEPVWAIGTGRIPTEEQIAEVHGFLRRDLLSRFGDGGAGIRILYGGSVKPANAAAIFALPDVDGALVGGASLLAADFAPIIRALDAA